MDAPATAVHDIAKFRPRPPWWGGDLQTLRTVPVRQRIDLSPSPEETLRFDMPDASGDVLTGQLGVRPGFCSACNKIPDPFSGKYFQNPQCAPNKRKTNRYHNKTKRKIID